jgi:toxin ParE1/3/4
MLSDKAGNAVAERYRREFEQLFERLVMFPLSRARRRLLGRNARIGVVEPYVVIYEHRADIVRIYGCWTAVGTLPAAFFADDCRG